MLKKNFLLCFGLPFILLLLSPLSVSAQNPAPTYTAMPTYTPLPTYTPYVQETQPTVPVVTSQPSAEENQADTESEETGRQIADYFLPIFQNQNFLDNGYVIDGYFYEESWAGAEQKNCFGLSFLENPGGRFCLLRDNRSELKPELRLIQMLRFEGISDSLLPRDLPPFADYSRVYTAREDNGSLFYLGFFVTGQWVGEFYLPDQPGQDMPAIISETAQKMISEFEVAPQDLPLSLTHVAYEEQVLPALKNGSFPEGIAPGTYRYAFDGFSGMYYFNLFSTTDFSSQGEVQVLPYAARLTDAINSIQDDFFGFDSKSIINTDFEAVGDSAVMFWVDPETIGYRFQKYNFIAEVHLKNQGMKTRQAVVAIARTMVENLPEVQVSQAPGSDDPLEEQFLQCFPAQGDLGFDFPLYRYSTFTQLTDTGFVYKTRYSATVGPTNASSFILDTLIYVYHDPITGQDMRKHTDYEVRIEQIGDYSYAEHRLRDPNPANYASLVYVVKGPVLIKLQVIESEDKESTLDHLVSLAQEMSACLPENPVLPQEISLPEMPDSTAIETGQVEVREISDLSSRMEALALELPAVESSGSGFPGKFVIYAGSELSGPLTVALYSPKYDLYTYRKQEIMPRTAGLQSEILLMKDLTESRSHEYHVLGEVELRIWIGEKLATVYPFYIGNWD